MRGGDAIGWSPQAKHLRSLSSLYPSQHSVERSRPSNLNHRTLSLGKRTGKSILLRVLYTCLRPCLAAALRRTFDLPARSTSSDTWESTVPDHQRLCELNQSEMPKIQPGPYSCMNQQHQHVVVNQTLATRPLRPFSELHSLKKSSSQRSHPVAQSNLAADLTELLRHSRLFPIPWVTADMLSRYSGRCFS